MNEGQDSRLNSPLARAFPFIFPTAPQEFHDPLQLPMSTETESIATTSLNDEDSSIGDDEGEYDLASISDDEDDHLSAPSSAPPSGDTHEASDRARATSDHQTRAAAGKFGYAIDVNEPAVLISKPLASLCGEKSYYEVYSEAEIPHDEHHESQDIGHAKQSDSGASHYGSAIHPACSDVGASTRSEGNSPIDAHQTVESWLEETKRCERGSRPPADRTNDLLDQSLSKIGLFALPGSEAEGNSDDQSITSASPSLARNKLREELTGDDDVFATDAVEAGTVPSDNGPATTSELPASATPDSTSRVDAPVAEERIKHLVAEALACHRYSDTRGSRIALQSKINDLGRDVQQLEDSLAALSETVTAHISAGQSGATTEFAKGHARGNSAADSSEVRSKAFISSDLLWSPADPPRASITNTRTSR